MRNTQTQADVLQDITEKTDWKIYKANDQSKTPIETAMDKFTNDQRTNVRDFFIAWNIPAAVIAERVRRAGFNAKLPDIELALIGENNDKTQLYVLGIAMQEMRNDMMNTFRPL